MALTRNRIASIKQISSLIFSIKVCHLLCVCVDFSDRLMNISDWRQILAIHCIFAMKYTFVSHHTNKCTAAKQKYRRYQADCISTETEFTQSISKREVLLFVFKFVVDLFLCSRLLIYLMIYIRLILSSRVMICFDIRNVTFISKLISCITTIYNIYQ